MFVRYARGVTKVISSTMADENNALLLIFDITNKKHGGIFFILTTLPIGSLMIPLAIGWFRDVHPFFRVAEYPTEFVSERFPWINAHLHVKKIGGSPATLLNGYLHQKIRMNLMIYRCIPFTVLSEASMSCSRKLFFSNESPPLGLSQCQRARSFMLTGVEMG